MSRTTLLALATIAASYGCGSTGHASEARPNGGVVIMEVTEAGYVPARIKVKRGEPLKLLITRKSDATCAKEIVIDEPKINTPLPLNKQVEVAFTPSASGDLKFGCSMDKMVSGIITVE